AVALGGVLAGIVVGGVLSQMLVAVLTGVFDPPPAGLAVPWGYLAASGVVALAAITAAALLATRPGKRPTVEYLREL
ncbi:MAG: hypothetical protein ABIO33_05315, partial [Leifsonia sp.]